MAGGLDQFDREEPNPYAAPTSGVSPTRRPIEADARAEEIRRDHIQQEASIKALGSLFYLGAIFGAIGTVALLILGTSGEMDVPEGVDPSVFTGIMVVIYGGFSVFYFVIGRGLRSLRGWARWTTVVLTGIGLLIGMLQVVVLLLINPVVGVASAFFGLLIPGYILYLLLNSRAGIIFSAGYREVVAVTPHVKPRTSLLAWMILLLFLLIIVFGIAAALLGVS